jgi:RNA polymerase sigma-70 factor, ECF subfamily
VGIEPTWGNPQRCLRPSRLPFRHFGTHGNRVYPNTNGPSSSFGHSLLVDWMLRALAHRQLQIRLPFQCLTWPLRRPLEWLLRAVSAHEEWGSGPARSAPPRRPEYDEPSLIAAAQRGELPAFNQLILHYQGLAYNVAYRIMGDADSASDATQDGFIKAFHKIGQYRGGSFKAWLLRITTNTCYDMLRAHKRRPTSSLEKEDEDPEHDSRLLDTTERPEAYVMRQELAEVLQAAIEKLPADQRIALVLSDIEGLDYQEIADSTGAALGTVKSRLSRARAHLRDLLLAQKELLPAQYRLMDDGR